MTDNRSAKQPVTFHRLGLCSAFTMISTGLTVSGTKHTKHTHTHTRTHTQPELSKYYTMQKMVTTRTLKHQKITPSRRYSLSHSLTHTRTHARTHTPTHAPTLKHTHTPRS